MNSQRESNENSELVSIVKAGQENSDRMFGRFIKAITETQSTINAVSKDVSSVASSVEILATKIESELDHERESKKRLYQELDKIRDEVKELKEKNESLSEKCHKLEMAIGSNKWQLSLIGFVAAGLFIAGINALFKFFAGGGA